VTHFIDKEMGGEGRFEPVRFSEFSSIQDALLSNRLQASFILAPLAMSLRERGAPIRIVYLGHRDGTACMVHKDSTIRSIEGLRGKTVAIPSRYSNQYLILFKAMDDRGLSIKDIKTIEMPPPDMPAALASRSVDAIIAGEPIMARTELSGYGRRLFITNEVWPEFISCVLAVREDVIRDRRDDVQRLVDGIARSGLWLDSGRDLTAVHSAVWAWSSPRSTVADACLALRVARSPVSGDADASMNHRMMAADFVSRQYYNYDPKLLRFVLSTPRDRVKYTNLSVQRGNFEEIEKYAKQAGVFQGNITFDDYTDTSFVPKGRVMKQWEWEGKK
jgi:NitT/TauT family transport system substrate-binding protein